MTGSILHQTKGIYSIISTFLLITIILFSVIGLIYIGNTVKLKRASLNDELVKYDYIMDVKNRLLSEKCYSKVISENGGENLAADEPCDLPAGVIKGYTIEILNYYNCTNKTWVHMFRNEDGDKLPYFVDVLNSEGIVCPGKLKVIY